MATFLDVAGAKYPAEFKGRKPLPLEGKSLVPVFEEKQRQGHEVLCWSLPRHHAIRMGKWKAVKPKNSKVWQLFDLDSDGTETIDLAKREPDRARALAAQFEKWRQRVGAN
jgi:arylsulfatase